MMKNRSSEIYLSLLGDIQKDAYSKGPHVYRKHVMNCGVPLIYSVAVEDKLRAILVPIEARDSKSFFDSCHGIEVNVVTLNDYSNDQVYVQYSQIENTDNLIFETVVEDLRLNLENKNPCSFVNTNNRVLKKWKNFFCSKKETILSSNEEIGLYGELFFLRKLVNIFGCNMVDSWAGPKNETHDFYIGSNAVEVKTTVKHAPYQAHINSEYQLDKKDVDGKLYLAMFAFRKDSSGLNTLPKLIEDIRENLSDDSHELDIFNDKIFKVGYIDLVEERYKNSFTLRNEFLFCVADGFPCVYKSMLPKGVYDVEYNLSIDLCEKYAVNPNEIDNILKE